MTNKKAIRLGLPISPNSRCWSPVNALVGGVLGQERSVLPLLAEKEFRPTSQSAALTYILAFGLTEAATNTSPAVGRTATAANLSCWPVGCHAGATAASRAGLAVDPEQLFDFFEKVCLRTEVAERVIAARMPVGDRGLHFGISARQTHIAAWCNPKLR